MTSSTAANRRVSRLPQGVVVTLAVGLVLSACGGPPKPEAVPNLPAPAPLTSPKVVVPAGQYGVAGVVTSIDPDDSIVAFKVGPVRRGQPGDLKGIWSMNGGTETLRNGVPYFANIHYAVLQGNPEADPMVKVGAFDSIRKEYPLVPLLGDDNELKKGCSEPVTDPEERKKLKVEHVDCFVFVFEDAKAVPDQLIYTNTPYGGGTGGDVLHLAIGAVA